MTDLREAAQQALGALEWLTSAEPGDEPPINAAITAIRAALAQQDEPCPNCASLESQNDELDRKLAELEQPVQEPVARECSDPMCACRGGPCAECEEGEREKEIEDLRSSLYFYQRRCEALQSWQSKMRDPERTIVCDILANGKTLDPAFAGDRYTAPPQQAEPMQQRAGTPLEAALHKAYYYTEEGKWRGTEAREWDRWHAVAKAAVALICPERSETREHVTDGTPCWCGSEAVYTDPDTGASVILHKRPQ